MERIKMAHGAGGEVMQELIKKVLLKHLDADKGEVPLGALDDSAVINDIVFTTDSHTVKPLFFPGGDIGSLSVAGTVNDIAVMGAKPLALSLGIILEEGFGIDDLEKIARSIGETSRLAEVPVITGDTKVVEKGSVEGVVINTSGIGMRTETLESNISKVREFRAFDERWLRDSNLKEGDRIILSGSVGDHGIALLSFREGYRFESKLKSDIYPLNSMIESALKVGGIVAIKDLTRGGLANALNEWNEKSRVGIFIEEEKIPLNEAVVSACDMLGLDPLEIGNEGKVIIGVVEEMADEVLREIRKSKEGRNAEIIGWVDKELRMVVMETVVGGSRVVETPVGDPIPRIC